MLMETRDAPLLQVKVTDDMTALDKTPKCLFLIHSNKESFKTSRGFFRAYLLCSCCCPVMRKRCSSGKWRTYKIKKKTQQLHLSECLP